MQGLVTAYLSPAGTEAAGVWGWYGDSSCQRFGGSGRGPSGCRAAGPSGSMGQEGQQWRGGRWWGLRLVGDQPPPSGDLGVFPNSGLQFATIVDGT